MRSIFPDSSGGFAGNRNQEDVYLYSRTKHFFCAFIEHSSCINEIAAVYQLCTYQYSHF